MRSARHNGRDSADQDKKLDFASPDARHSAARTASHRYLPTELRSGGARAAAGAASRAAIDDAFSPQDFKARWWPAPDAWQ